MATHQVKTKAPEPQLTGDFQADARTFAGDKKLSEKERGLLLGAFKKLDRDQQLKAVDFLKGESGVLSSFAKSNSSFNAKTNQRVGGDRSLADFKNIVDGSKERGFNAFETANISKEYRALSKTDQAQAVSDLRADGQNKLADALEKSITPVKLTTKQQAAVGTKDLQAFGDAAAAFKTKSGFKERTAVLDTFKKLSDADKQEALTQIKNQDPKLAVQLDRILNPRPVMEEGGSLFQGFKF